MVRWLSLYPSLLALFFFKWISRWNIFCGFHNLPGFKTHEKAKCWLKPPHAGLIVHNPLLPSSSPPHFSSSKKLLPGTWLKLILVVSFRHLGFGQPARLGSWSPSEPFKLPESRDQVPAAHQHNGDFKLARWLKFNKIFINVLAFSLGPSIICMAASIQNTVYTVTDI